MLRQGTGTVPPAVRAQRTAAHLFLAELSFFLAHPPFLLFQSFLALLSLCTGTLLRKPLLLGLLVHLRLTGHPRGA